ncbi:MAG TPA: hypothetical protein VKU60_14950 [Chloroflexota bacterium]|nr:hypothetical protein [Chloroflexota bacterium]
MTGTNFILTYVAGFAPGFVFGMLFGVELVIRSLRHQGHPRP